MARRFEIPITADEYERMIARGLLTEFDRVELIEGEILEKMTEGDSHALCLITLNHIFRFRAPADLLIAVNSPARIALDSIPDPMSSSYGSCRSNSADGPAPRTSSC